MAAAQLRLAPAPPPAAATTPPEPNVVLAATDAAGRCVAAATADGRLHLLPLQPRASAADADAFALMLLREGEQPQLLARPWAALALLSPAAGRGGLLCAQAGSGRLLYCQHPAAALELCEDGAEAFLLGCHEDPITALAASSCGSLALSADSGGSLKLWGLADGTSLASMWGGAGSGPVTAACFLPDEPSVAGGAPCAVATARGSLVSVWSCQEGSLELISELSVAGSSGGSSSSSSAITVLAGTGQLLAAGCSDGTALLWRRTAGADWVQHALLPAPAALPREVGIEVEAGAAAASVQAPCFSRDASLLATAAGPAVSLCCTASGKLLAQQVLPEAPAGLFWTSSDQLLALMPRGNLQPLGMPEQPLPQQQQQDAALIAPAHVSAATAAPARMPPRMALTADTQRTSATAVLGPKQGKSVRFAEACHEVREPAAELGEPEERLPVLLQAVAPRPRAGRSAPPPPLPSHPLLRGGTNSTGSSMQDEVNKVLRGNGVAVSNGSNSASLPAAGNARRPAASATPAAVAIAAARAAAAAVKPLYPILDLRALRGLQAAAPAPASAPAASSAAPPALCAPQPIPKPAPFVQPVQKATAASPAGTSTTQSLQHLAAGTQPASAGTSSWQQPPGQEEQPGAAKQAAPSLAFPAPDPLHLQHGTVAVEAPAGAGAEEELEPRRRRLLPAPTRRPGSPLSSSPTRSPGRTSKQSCGACAVQTGTASNSRLGSPAKADMLAHLSALREQNEGPAACATAGSSKGMRAVVLGSSRPASPLKLGVACTLEAQQQGELQAAEVQSHTVLELDASLPLAALRRQRFARLSRRYTFAGKAATSGQQQEHAQHLLPPDCWRISTEFPASGGAASSVDEPPTVQERAAGQAAVTPSEAGTAALAGTGQEGEASAAPATNFAVASDAELSSDEEDEKEAGPAEQQDASQAQSSSSAAAATSFPAPAQVPGRVAAASEACSGSLEEAADVRPRAHLPMQAARAVAGGQPTQAAGEPAAAPSSRLAQHSGTAPAARSSPLGQVAGLLCQLDSRLSMLAGRVQRRQVPDASMERCGTAGGAFPARAACTLQQTAAAPARLAEEGKEADDPVPTSAAPAAVAAALLPGQHWHLEQAPPIGMACPLAVPSSATPAHPSSSQPPLAAAPEAALPSGSALAAPALNSSLLQLHQASLLQHQAASAAVAPSVLPAEQVQAARRRAAKAATTLPPGARLFGPLPPPEVPPASQLSAAKAAALAGAKKQVDERWVAEQAELRPTLEQLWVAEQRLPQRSGLAPLAPLVVPVPDGRRMAAELLGLRL